MIAVAVLVVGVCVRTFLVTPFSIPSGSMEDTLLVGDRILVDRATYRVRDVQRGEIVVFDGSDTFGAIGGEPDRGLVGGLVHSVAASVGLARPPETDYVKRVVGIGGDRVVCCDEEGRITVNGQPVDESAYLHEGDRPSDLRFDVEVPPGRLWVMGDHRSNSRDSRAHLGDPGGGTIPVDDDIGRVVGVVWPFSRLGGIA
jgi:signal peptidase I